MRGCSFSAAQERTKEGCPVFVKAATKTRLRGNAFLRSWAGRRRRPCDARSASLKTEGISRENACILHEDSLRFSFAQELAWQRKCGSRKQMRLRGQASSRDAFLQLFSQKKARTLPRQVWILSICSSRPSSSNTMMSRTPRRTAWPSLRFLYSWPLAITRTRVSPTRTRQSSTSPR